MKNSFAARLSELRRRSGLSQKETADALGVSQALLSHYEKGIRECGLDFLCKAAAYFDVSCDYMLGMSDTKDDFAENFDKGENILDSEYRMNTVLRAVMMLYSRYSDADLGKDAEVKNYFALAVYRLAIIASQAECIPKSWINLPNDSALAACNAQAEMISNALNAEVSKKHAKNTVEPECLKTVISAAEKAVTKECERIVSSQNT